MRELTTVVARASPHLDEVWRAAVDTGTRPGDDYRILAAMRADHGFKETPAPLLTAPDGNLKLRKSATPTYGLTLQHHRSVLHGLSVNACPNAGHCVKVCVLDNGNGRHDNVQRARKWRTELLARHADTFVRILAWELVRAVDKHGAILFRPNVNSDVAWQTILPSMTNGHLPGLMLYGYSKRPETLEGDGWLGSAYRVAYSWNERSDRAAVRAFLMRGGAVAVVTSRRKGDPVGTVFPFGTTANAVDADITDEWMLTAGMVVGDLSAKGKARGLIGRSGFVVQHNCEGR